MKTAFNDENGTLMCFLCLRVQTCDAAHLTPVRGSRGQLGARVRQGWFVCCEYRAQGTQMSESTAKHTMEMKGQVKGAMKIEVNQETETAEQRLSETEN